MRVVTDKRPSYSTFLRKRRAMRELFPRLVDLIPEGKSGNVEVKHCRPDEAECLTAWYSRGELIFPDPFVQMNIDGLGWMHDILEEQLKNATIARRAHGDVLIGGLGLGMILHPILRNPAVRSVQVLEINPHVVELILPSLDNVPGREKLALTMTDAATWEPASGEMFDTIWLDCIAWWAPDVRFIRVVERWMNRYQPWLRKTAESYIGHWAFEEAFRRLQRPLRTADVHLDLDGPWINRDNAELLKAALAAAPAPQSGGS